jgi:hypothetical protein
MDTANALKKIREFQTIRQRYAPTIIATGVFSDYEEWTEIASGIGESKATKTSRALEGLLGKEYVPNPDRPTETIAKVDLLAQLWTPYLDAGFLVGLAVGMQLGPHAFDGIEATKGTRR